MLVAVVELLAVVGPVAVGLAAGGRCWCGRRAAGR
jgi:hypothetical protein